MLVHVGDINVVQHDFSRIGQPASADCVKQRTFSGAIGANDGNKISVLQGNAQIPDRSMLIYGIFLKGFGNMIYY